MKSVREPRILDILQRKEMSTSELCVLVHCTQRSAQELLARLKRKGLVYRSGWRRQPDGIAALFKAGIGVRNGSNENAPGKLKRTKSFAWRVRKQRASNQGAIL